MVEYEYGIMRPSQTPDMSGSYPLVQVVSVTFRTLADAQGAARAVPSLRGVPHVIAKRPAPGPWKVVT